MPDGLISDNLASCSSATGRSDTRGCVSVEFGEDSPIIRWRGVSVNSYPREEVTLGDLAPLGLTEECFVVASQVKHMLDEGRTTVLKLIWNRYETYLRQQGATVPIDAEDAHEQDEDSSRRLHAFLDRLGITDQRKRT